jgi:hypothetical protein
MTPTEMYKFGPPPVVSSVPGGYPPAFTAAGPGAVFIVSAEIGPGPASSSPDWKPKAKAALPLVIAAGVLSLLCLIFAIISLAAKWLRLTLSIPVFSITFDSEYTLYSETVCTTSPAASGCQTGTGSISSAVFVLAILAVFALAQFILAAILSVRVRKTASGTFLPWGCCTAHTTAVVGVAWTSVILSIVAIAMGRSYFLNGTLGDLSSYENVSWGLGHALAIVNVFVAMAAAALATAADIRLKGVVGVGKPANACCPPCS